MIRFVHIRNSANTGDLASCPAQYFDFGKHEIFNYSDDIPDGGTVVYGGGTMVNWLAMHRPPLPKGRRVLWGAGSSRHGRVDPWPDPLGFDLLGIREWAANDEAAGKYVPCVSCMSPLFDAEYEIKCRAIRFINADPAIKSAYPTAAGDLPTTNNAQPLDRIIPLLGSAEVIVTNSYHGVYWGALLGRRVVCVPYSSKFHWFKFPPVMSIDGSDWQEKALEAKVYPDALEDCRRINRAFYARVMDLAA